MITSLDLLRRMRAIGGMAVVVAVTVTVGVIYSRVSLLSGHGGLWDVPWRKAALMMFRTSPIQPIIRTSLGSSMSGERLATTLSPRHRRGRTLERDKPLDCLEEDADAKCQEKDAIEESAKERCALPSKREILRRVATLRDLGGTVNFFLLPVDGAFWVFHTIRAVSATTKPTRSLSLHEVSMKRTLVPEVRGKGRYVMEGICHQGERLGKEGHLRTRDRSAKRRSENRQALGIPRTDNLGDEETKGDADGDDQPGLGRETNGSHVAFGPGCPEVAGRLTGRVDEGQRSLKWEKNFRPPTGYLGGGI